MSLLNPKSAARIFALSLLLNAGRVWSCAVCFGGENSDLSRGFYWGILLLMMLPLILFLAIGGAVFYHIRQKQSRGEVSATHVS